MQAKNVLLITTDQQRFDTIAAMGYPWMKTPNLDKLAAQGMGFSNACCASPVCMPSRSSIITGQYPSRHQCWANGVCLPEETKTLAHHLSESGYFTKCIGKMHFQSATGETQEGGQKASDWEYLKQWNGPYYGFEKAELSIGHGDENHVYALHYGLWLKENGIDDKYFKAKSSSEFPKSWQWDLPEQYHQASWVTERTLATLDLVKDDPFFIWTSFQDPHCPWLIPSDWDSLYDDEEIPDNIPESLAEMNDVYKKTLEGKFDETGLNEEHYVHCFQYSHALNKLPDKEQKMLRKIYHAQISMVDNYVGKIISYLEDNNLRDNTIVIFTADHGEFHGDHGLWGKGMFHYQSTIRVPFMISCPSVIPCGVISDALISGVDIAPTVKGLLNLDYEEKYQGINQADVCRGEKDYLRNACLIEDRGNPTKCDVKTIITSRYRFSYWSYDNWGEIYDLENDPDELENLWDREGYADIKNKLFQKMLEVLTERERPLKRRAYQV